MAWNPKVKKGFILKKHGFTSSVYKPPEYIAWGNMKQRCFNKNFVSYHRYGGRGITVCERWLNSFENFISDMGFRPAKGYSIDRINNDGNYEPSNCRWATKTEQLLNRKCANQYTTRRL